MSQKARKLAVFGYPRRCPAMYTFASSCQGKPVPWRWMPAKFLSASSSSPSVSGMGASLMRSMLGTVRVRVGSSGALACSAALCFCVCSGASGATASSGGVSSEPPQAVRTIIIASAAAITNKSFRMRTFPLSLAQSNGTGARGIGARRLSRNHTVPKFGRVSSTKSRVVAAHCLTLWFRLSR
jgi:hypothetical protein